VAPHRGEQFHALARFCTRIFAVAFAMGVGSGIPRSFSWPSSGS
jgi:cytochrome bd-type quinol oxidase subunit 1